MFRPFTIIGAVLLSAFLMSQAHAACTYSEAVMAYNSGNLIRGQALMKMAAKDGDQRAVRFLASVNADKHSDNGIARNETLLVMESLETAKSTAEKLN